MTRVDDEDSTGTRDQLLKEHQHIRDAVERLEGARELREMLEHLQQFRSLIEPHFLNEEAPDGFFDVVRSRAARHVARVDQLARDHEAFLRDVDRLAERARACLDGPVAALLREARELARRLYEHEALENALLVDAMYFDSGLSE